MEKALCWLSFDFDLTLTSVHTWNELGIRNSHENNIEMAGSGAVTLCNSLLLRNVIEFVCERGMIFCITTMQHGAIVRAAMVADPLINAVIEQYEGTQFFIIDRDQVRAFGGKAFTQRSALNVMKRFSGIHFDDDNREIDKFDLMNISFQEMPERTGFSSSMSSTLYQAISKIRDFGFSNVAFANNYPQRVNTGSLARSIIPLGHDFRFTARHSSQYPLTGFIDDLLALIISSTDQDACAAGA